MYWPRTTDAPVDDRNSFGQPPVVVAHCRFAFAFLPSLAGFIGVLLDGRDARGADAFEIQVYDGTADAPGVPGLELHANDALGGVRTAAPPELPPHHLLHLTLEPSLGLTSFWEIGGYLQTAVRPDDRFDFAGAKLRSKFVTPPDWRAQLRLGCNVEIAYLPPRYDQQRWGAELRPIVAWESDHWLFAANPIVGFPLTQAAATFEPAAMALFKIPDKVSFGIEYYADLGTFLGTGYGGPQEHLLFEVVNLLAVSDMELNIGIGEGLTTGSNHLVAKLVAGYSFDRFSSKGSSTPSGQVSRRDVGQPPAAAFPAAP